MHVQVEEAFHPKANGRLVETLKGAEECIQTNYYGLKTTTQSLIPLLQLSDSPTIVNVSSSMGNLLVPVFQLFKPTPQSSYINLLINSSCIFSFFQMNGLKEC